LEREADVNARNKDGWTPLQLAVVNAYEKERKSELSALHAGVAIHYHPLPITPILNNRTNKEGTREIVELLLEARLKQVADIALTHTRDIEGAIEFILTRKILPHHYKLEEIPEAIARLNAYYRKNEQIKSQGTYNEFRDKDPGLPPYKTVFNLFKQKQGGNEKELSNFMFGGTCEGTFDSP